MQTTAGPQALAARVTLLRASLTRERLTSTTALLLYIALAAFLAHLLVAGNYGYFRDELYYMAAGRHLAPGYVDFPPFIALVAALLRVTTDDNLIALHVVSGAASAALIFTTGMIARELGGKRLAQVLAALGALCNITYLATGSIFSYDVFDELAWALAAYVFIRLIRREQPRLWLLFGLVVGLGLTNKLSLLYFGFAFVAGLLLTRDGRAQFRTRWIWLGGLIALAFLLPYALWNAANGWPTLAFWSSYGDRLVDQSLLGFLGEQLYTTNPLTVPLWITGLYWLLRAPAARPYRALGIAYVVLFFVFGLTHFKTYFLAPAYPFLYAAGAGVFERGFERASAAGRRRWLLPSYTGVMLLTGILLAPVAMPILPPPTFGQVYGFLGGDAGAQMERHQTGILPQWLGDRYGWDTLTAAVAGVYRALPADQRSQACVITDNYGEAGALQFLGTRYGLPPVISGHNSYWLWGPGSCTGRVLIVVNGDVAQMHASFGSVVLAATAVCHYCMPYEDNLPIYVCTQPTFRHIQDVWPAVRHYN